MKDYDYEYNSKLKHHQAPAYLDTETGEFVEITTNRTLVDKDYELFKSKEKFHRTFTKSWILLEQMCSTEEIGIAHKLAIRSSYKDGVIEVINGEISYRALSTELGVDRRKLKPVIEKFINIGVFAYVKIANGDNTTSEKYLFNPYLSFNGNLIDKNLKSLFKSSIFATINK